MGCCLSESSAGGVVRGVEVGLVRGRYCLAFGYFVGRLRSFGLVDSGVGVDLGGACQG